MPYFKQTGSSSRGNDNLMHGEGQSIISPLKEEQRIANSVILDKLETKDTPLSRMTSYKTTVVYYQQKVTGRNDYVINTANLGNTDVNKLAFYKIKDFIILCSDPLNVSLEKNEGSTSLMGDGSANILPKTIKPMVNDYFLMNTLGKNNLYRITEVNKSSIEQDSAYQVNYQLIEEDSVEQLTKLEENVVDTYRFIYSHVGTSFRTIFRDDEYDALEKMEKMYQCIGEMFNESYYNNDKNTYVLKYNQLDIKNEDGVPISESRVENMPWSYEKTYNKNESYSIPPKLNDSDVWYGSLMYDRMLVEFITKNSIFTNVNRKIYRVTQLQEDLERWYSKTIFYAIEKQSNKRFDFRYFIPSPITRLTIAGSLNLYGVVSLEPSMDFHKGCLNLYPSDLIDYTINPNLLLEERSEKDLSMNVYRSAIDLICEIIGLYINKKEDLIVDRILLLDEYIEEFNELSIGDQHAFYLYPMLAYVIRKSMDRLSDANFGLIMK